MRIHGLSGRPELNERLGRAVRYDEAKERYEVRVEGEPQAVLLRGVSLDDEAAGSKLDQLKVGNDGDAPPPPPLGPPPTAVEPAGAAMSTSAKVPEEIGWAATRGELHTVVKWLREGGHVDALLNAEYEEGRSCSMALMHTAAMAGQLELAKEVLQWGATVNLPNDLGITPLNIAVRNGQSAVLLLLLEHLANPNLQDFVGCTALIGAAGQGHEVRGGPASSKRQHQALR